MVNRISAAGLQVRPYFYRYGEDALDLCDVLGSYVPGAKVKVDEVSKILGLTGKPEGVDGSRVESDTRAQALVARAASTISMFGASSVIARVIGPSRLGRHGFRDFQIWPKPS